MAATTDSNCSKRLKVVSYNLHGFNQGSVAMDELIIRDNPDVFLCQEHWLTPANLQRFDDRFPNYFSFGCSAMSERVSTGIITGRPFGGVMILVKKDFRKFTQTIYCEERFAIIKIANYIIVNVYLPCAGTDGRQVICEAILHDIWSWRERFSDCECILAGDFNVNLDSIDDLACLINRFVNSYNLVRCDRLFPGQGYATYINISLNQCSYIDYVLGSSSHDILDFMISDPDINLSDHLPIMVTLEISFDPAIAKKDAISKGPYPVQTQLRWDKADIMSYYYYTGCNLEPIMNHLDELVELQSSNRCIELSEKIDLLYSEIVSVLNNGSSLYVPSCRKGFWKFWWDEELDRLKEASIDSNRVWKSAGKPRQGSIFVKRQQCRAQYRKRLRDGQKLSTTTYTNELHEALLAKDGPTFWKVWRSKFQTQSKCGEVGGFTDDELIVDNFAKYFSELYVPNSHQRSALLHDEYLERRKNYFGFQIGRLILN